MKSMVKAMPLWWMMKQRTEFDRHPLFRLRIRSKMKTYISHTQNVAQFPKILTSMKENMRRGSEVSYTRKLCVADHEGIQWKVWRHQTRRRKNESSITWSRNRCWHPFDAHEGFDVDDPRKIYPEWISWANMILLRASHGLLWYSSRKR